MENDVCMKLFDGARLNTDVDVKAAEEIFKEQIAIEMNKVFAVEIQRFDSKRNSFVWCKSDRPIYDRWLWHPMLDNKGMGF